MPLKGSQRGASQCGALCVWAALLLGGIAAAPTAFACSADGFHARVSVAQVFDGDTVRTRDGQRVRFVGIDTPEMNHRDGRPEPLAEAARDTVRRLLGSTRNLHLRFDAERRDKYGRLLAHPYLPDGQSLVRHLLASGLGTALAVPPNLWNLDCYRAAEGEAREAGRGIWALPAYRPVPAADAGELRGFRLVAGRVDRVGESRKSVWLNLDGPVAVRIARSELDYFGGTDALRALHGKRILVRGWLHAHNRGGAMLRVRHPAALQTFD